MSIIIRLKDTGEVFDVFPDFKLEVKLTSPIFNDLGSKTIATTLPKTPHNIRLFEFGHRIDTKSKARTKMSVIVNSGSYVRVGMLYRSASDNVEENFSITIAFNEGIMYESMKDILLSQLTSLPVVRKTISEYFEYFNRLLLGQSIEDPLSIFTVWLKESKYTPENSSTEVVVFEILNHKFYSQVDGHAELYNRTTADILNDGKLIQLAVPYGYGVTPFVKVWYILEAIFEHFGYKISKNPFKEHYQLKRLCVLNNLVGSIMEGILDYKQLMPTVSVMDFLQSLYTRFGLKVFFNSNTNEVNLILLKDIFADIEHQKLDPSTPLIIEEPTPKQLKLSAAKSLDKSSTDTDTYEEFLAKNKNIIGTYPAYSDQVEVGGIYYKNSTGLFYQRSTTHKEQKVVSSIHFDWNKKDTDLETEDIVSIDECITMVKVPYFAVDPNFVNLVLEVDGVESTSAENSVLSFAYDMGGTYTDSKEYISHSYGSIFPNFESMTIKDLDDNEMQYALTFVGEYGAFNQFFKAYDAFLRHSNRLIKFKSSVNSFHLSTIEFDQQVIVNNQTLLLDKVDYELGGKQIVESSIEGRTTYLYEPHDLDKEQMLPVADDILYKWVLSADRDRNIEGKRGELEKEKAKLDDSFTWIFVSLVFDEILKEPNPPGDATFWFLPPNKEQFDNKTKTGGRKHNCTVRYIHTYKQNHGTIADTRWQTHTENIDVVVDYDSWFEAEPL